MYSKHRPLIMKPWTKLSVFSPYMFLLTLRCSNCGVSHAPKKRQMSVISAHIQPHLSLFWKLEIVWQSRKVLNYESASEKCKIRTPISSIILFLNRFLYRCFNVLWVHWLHSFCLLFAPVHFIGPLSCSFLSWQGVFERDMRPMWEWQVYQPNW